MSVVVKTKRLKTSSLCCSVCVLNLYDRDADFTEDPGESRGMPSREKK